MLSKNEIIDNPDFLTELENDPFDQDPSVDPNLERSLHDKPTLDKKDSFEYKMTELEFPAEDQNDDMDFDGENEK